MVDIKRHLFDLSIAKGSECSLVFKFFRTHSGTQSFFKLFTQVMICIQIKRI